MPKKLIKTHKNTLILDLKSNFKNVAGLSAMDKAPWESHLEASNVSRFGCKVTLAWDPFYFLYTCPLLRWSKQWPANSGLNKAEFTVRSTGLKEMERPRYSAKEEKVHQIQQDSKVKSLVGPEGRASARACVWCFHWAWREQVQDGLCQRSNRTRVLWQIHPPVHAPSLTRLWL